MSRQRWVPKSAIGKRLQRIVDSDSSSSSDDSEDQTGTGDDEEQDSEDEEEATQAAEPTAEGSGGNAAGYREARPRPKRRLNLSK